MFFDFLHDRHRPLTINEVDGNAALAKPASPADPVQVCFEIRFTRGLNWQIVIYYDSNL